ncbi:MAG: hypothetical protein WC760_06405 [Bacteroidia bacterium]|jgi:hypothetical protein
MSRKKLKPEVAAKYEVVGAHIHGHFPKWGNIDMSELSLPAADGLVKQGFPYLKEKPAKPASTKKQTAE